MTIIPLPFAIGETIYWRGHVPPKPLTVVAYRRNQMISSYLDIQTESGDWWTYLEEQFSREPITPPVPAGPRLIAFFGPIGSGKSTAADAVLRHVQGHHTRCELVSIASPIKKMLAALDETQSSWGKNTTPNSLCGRSVRHALQTLGTEWGRDCIHPDFWINIARARMENGWKTDPSCVFVIDDLRYENEARVVRELGGKLVRISRPARGKGTDEHRSEQNWKEIVWDCCIRNDDCTEAGFRQLVINVLERWLP